MDKENEDAKAILEKLPDGCSLEDVQYHLYVVEKIRRGIECAEQEGTISQGEAEKNFSKWTSKKVGVTNPSKADCISPVLSQRFRTGETMSKIAHSAHNRALNPRDCP